MAVSDPVATCRYRAVLQVTQITGSERWLVGKRLPRPPRPPRPPAPAAPAEPAEPVPHGVATRVPGGFTAQGALALGSGCFIAVFGGDRRAEGVAGSDSEVGD